MYPGNYNNDEWLGYKSEPIDEVPKIGSVARAWQWRERGINPPNQPPNKTVLENIAEDILVQKPLQITSCDLPGYPRSTFLMVFSPDGTKLASTHGNHNIYVSELASGKHVRILKGHPRTPWCIAFHPSHPQLIGSGCLGGQVRVWDIASGGSEVWNVRNETVIASIAFHPREQLLVIATYNELYFWDWSKPAPFSKVSTNNTNEKVRYVAFDSLGFKLITGISLWACASTAGSNPLPTHAVPPMPPTPPNGNTRPDNNDDPPPRPTDNPAAAQDMIVNSYQTLVQRYDSLVRNYQRLFMVRHRLINTPLAHTIDRGTDPMESFPPELGLPRRRPTRRPPRGPNEPDSPMAGPSQPPEAGDSQRMPEPIMHHAALIMAQQLGMDPESVRETDVVEPSVPLFRSAASAFQPLGDERTTRLLPNPFSSTNGSPRQPNSSRTSGIFRGADSALSALRQFSIRRRNLDAAELGTRNMDSRAIPPDPRRRRFDINSVFEELFQITSTTGPANTNPAPTNPNLAARNTNPTPANANPVSAAYAPGNADPLSANMDYAPGNADPLSVNMDYAPGNADPLLANMDFVPVNADLLSGNMGYEPGNDDPIFGFPEPTVTIPIPPVYTPPPLPTEPPPSRPPPPPDPMIPPEPSTSARTTSNSATQSNSDGEANSINESLDLIRDILRDSGTRLLNLITNMSVNILSNSDPDEGANDAQARLRAFTGTLRREFLASDSESEGDNANSEVNIRRTPNSTFREGSTDTPDGNRARNTSAESRMNEHYLGSMGLSDRYDIPGLITLDPNDDPYDMIGALNIPYPTRRQEEVFRNVPAPPIPVPAPPNIATPASEPPAEPSPTPVPESAPTPLATDEPNPGPSTAREFDPNMPSTSRDTFWSQHPDMEPTVAYVRVRQGVAALQKHTLQLANMWLRGDRTSLRDLRMMWEDLRRRIITLNNNNRQSRPENRSAYTRSLLERCMILTEMTEMTDNLATRQLGRRLATRRNMRREDNAGNDTNAATSNDTNAATSNATNAATSNATSAATSNATNAATNNDTNATASNVPAGPSPSTESNESRSSRPTRGARNGSQTSQRRRLLPSYRWRQEDELRRRTRNVPVYRLSQFRGRNRSELMRSVEMNATRHVIRTRAMKVLSIMFNMMMMCLDQRGLSQLIINMLKTLKKALALTCFMMMSNRSPPRASAGAAPPAQNVDSADVVRIQNVEHPGPVNVDGPDEASSVEAPKLPQASTTQASTTETAQPTAAAPQASTSQASTPVGELPSPSPNSAAADGWSQRLAVQISAANRNNSVTARTRRADYLEARRQKALHRTNPLAHPFIRRRFPAVAGHRIPALRRLPPGQGAALRMARGPESNPGPSNAPLLGPANQFDQMYQFGNRDNVIRLAHLRLRTAARNRFRRLQTIRLYTPSSVREMFALQDLPPDNPLENNSPEASGPRPFAPGPQPGPSREPGRIREFHAMMTSDGLALPLMQVNELPPAVEAQLGQGQRLPRIHEYLQPIILAQNAMVVDEDEGGPPGPGGPQGPRRFGGMAGLLDAGIISEALPAPSHRVQAWDFTTGTAPDIADSQCNMFIDTKNVVVQRCRIHNDASIDISKDGRLLVALLPVPRLRNTNNWLGVYSLEWPRLGQCLHTAVLEQSAVSVALSPTARYLAVGLGSRRFTSSHSRTNIIALLYKLDPLESSSRTGLSPMKELEQYWEHGFTSLNCLRWAPQPGQGLVYANNTGQLIIMS